MLGALWTGSGYFCRLSAVKMAEHESIMSLSFLLWDVKVVNSTKSGDGSR